MIYLDIIGRCGNQMFQYAFAKHLALIKNDNISVNFRLLESYDEKYKDGTFRDELFNFGLYDSLSHHTKALNISEHGSLKQKLVFKIYRYVRKLYGKKGKNPHKAEIRFRNILARNGIFLDNCWAEKPFILKKIKQKNVFVKGYFENTEYHKNIREELLKDFTLKKAVCDCNREMLDKINSSNSVCVSFRKWEVDGRDFDTPNYYRNAIAYIKERVENPLFVIFSNDVNWVKENFDLPENCIFENADNSISDKLALMGSCKHFIITNSTFCWWTSFLGTYENKITVCPKIWLPGCKEQPIIPEDFVLL